MFTPATRSVPWILRVAIAATLGGVALGMPFTYQGRLVDGASLANGDYELTFRVFDGLTAGTQVGSDVVVASAGVTNGLFTATLDFGDGVFNGASRWLELGARAAGSADPVQVLSPRQAINAVPYALHALSGSGDASALTTGTLADARLSGNIARTTDLLTVSNTFTGRLDATNAAVQGQLTQLASQISQLTAALLSVSNQFFASLPPGAVAASVNDGDTNLAAMGLGQFGRLDAPGWKSGSTAGAPGARQGHTGIWTGSKFVVWGGTASGVPSGSGGHYDPATDSWTTVSPIDAPVARSGHSAVWTGDRMIIWGGFGSGFLGTGGSYSPETLIWSNLATAGAPAGRDGQSAVWTGARLLIWGGRNGDGLLPDGAAYDAGANSWSGLPSIDAPGARRLATAVWAGDRLVIFGGEGPSGELGDGAMLTFTGGTTPGAWTALASLGAPSPRIGHSAVWTGSRMIVWGGKNGGAPLGDGAIFDPVANAWSPLPGSGAPAGRFGHSAVWTGSEMLVSGGENASGPIASGGAFDPASGHWRALSDAGQPIARSGAAGVWSGTELIVFGGLTGSAPPTAVASLQRLNPQPTWYLYRKP